MLRKISVIAISAAFAACVFGATAGFSEDATPLRMRGTLDQVNGNTLTIKTKSGTPVTVQLKDGAPVVAVTKGAMSDVQTNSFVGIASMPQPDGSLKAVEVSVFAEPLRGTAEGHYPWDLMPGSSMTNAAVTKQVTKQLLSWWILTKSRSWSPSQTRREPSGDGTEPVGSRASNRPQCQDLHPEVGEKGETTTSLTRWLGRCLMGLRRTNSAPHHTVAVVINIAAVPSAAAISACGVCTSRHLAPATCQPHCAAARRVDTC